MTSSITGELVNLDANAKSNVPALLTTPYAIPTLATATAPKGHIIDDSARGTLFWEAENSDQDNDDNKEPSEMKKTNEGYDSTPGSIWGQQFSIQWIWMTRLPFYRTRGLCNLFNANQEIKTARDGTELGPSIERRLI